MTEDGGTNIGFYILPGWQLDRLMHVRSLGMPAYWYVELMNRQGRIAKGDGDTIHDAIASATKEARNEQHGA